MYTACFGELCLLGAGGGCVCVCEMVFNNNTN